VRPKNYNADAPELPPAIACVEIGRVSKSRHLCAFSSVLKWNMLWRLEKGGPDIPYQVPGRWVERTKKRVVAQNQEVQRSTRTIAPCSQITQGMRWPETLHASLPLLVLFLTKVLQITLTTTHTRLIKPRQITILPRRASDSVYEQCVRKFNNIPLQPWRGMEH
jgi:hypothetical protein